MSRLIAVVFLALLTHASAAEEGAKKKKTPAKHEPAVATTPPAEPGPAAATEGPAGSKPRPHYGRPATLGTEALKEFETLPADRKKLIDGALKVARDSPWLPYRFGCSDPKDGGFDCSGAMYFVMQKAGLEPPRSSAEQYLWLKESGRLHEIPAAAGELDHPSFKNLTPGDLLFWGGTYEPTDGRKVNVTHIALFLGHEKEDGRAVMINATDGRSYRGVKANGYGVYDFKLPREGSGRAVFMGYGTPPGIKSAE